MNKNNRPSPLAMAAAIVALGTAQASWAAATPLPSNVSSWETAGSTGTSGPAGDIGDSTLFANGSFGYVTTADSTANGGALTPAVQSGETNGSRLRSTAFAANAGDTLSMAFNYITTDGSEFADYGWARIINESNSSTVAWLFTVRSGNRNTGRMIPGDITPAFNPDATIVNFGAFDFNRTTTPISSLLGDSSGLCFADVGSCGNTGWLQSRYSFTAGGRFRVEVGVTNIQDNLYDSALAFDFQGLTGSAVTPSVPEPSSAWLLLAGGLAGMGTLRRRQTAR
ncbi:putative PEP-CTERM exosortase interaction domain-containing protein [Rubrivivax sp. A210]|uniref:NF038132 family protein n=1 Tax=Rubrivivax sp. A210 TaxID=2772301 RepID=UPI00191B431A|nr:NF038132 family protein [Rubrivivax sp. A210]CAD5372014.1 putative PEP-CTERM exosortase interaction domain-containing protein [Rubrivivax sp. A210]